MNYLAVGWFTKGTPYAKEAKEWWASAEKHGIKNTIQSVPKFKTWGQAVAAKPAILRQIFNQFPEYDGYLAVDVDARFRGKPNADRYAQTGFACHTWKRTPRHEVEYLTGTMWFLNCNTTMDFLDCWAEESKPLAHMDCPEQQALRKIIDDWRPIITVDQLPVEWCYIFDDHAKMYPDKSPLIVHYQKSRQYREELS